MSKRLLQRGRYPKGPGVSHINNSNSQFPPPAPVSQPSQPGVSYFDPSQPPQPDQNAWNQQSYAATTNYQQTTTSNAPPVSEPANYWSGAQMFPNTMQAPWNESWNSKPDSSANNSEYIYQQPPAVQAAQQWQQAPYMATDNQSYSQPQMETYNSQFQQGYQYPPTNEYQHSTNVSNNQPANNSEYQSSNNLVNNLPPTSSYQFNNSSEFPSANNNSMQPSMPLQNWENGTLPHVTKPEELPWTYSTPQYSNPPLNDYAQIPNSSANVPWHPSVSSNQDVSSEHNIQNTPHNYLPLDSNNISNQMPLESETVVPQTISQQTEQTQSDVNSGVSMQQEFCDTDYSASTLSAFFHPSDLVKPDNEIPEDSREVVSDDLQNIESSSQETHSMALVGENGSVKTSRAASEEGSLEGTCSSGFVQEESLNDPVKGSFSNSPSPCLTEEPVNQEVPEPPGSNLSNLSVKGEKDSDESGEEPQNQQVPSQSGQSSRSTSVEREKIVIRPREESPFKPPKTNSSKSIVVQKETSVSPVETKIPEDKTVVQEVNLETFPDNLERPSDYEELRKQSPLYAHKRHLRQELNSSPSSLLCDNPDIPCVTLAPAAPPISSAKSDKSESSTDSRSDGLSLRSSNLSLYNLQESLPKGLCSDKISKVERPELLQQNKQPLIMQQAIPPNSENPLYSYNNSLPKTKDNDLHNLGNSVSQPPMLLKDSKISSKTHINEKPQEYDQRSSSADYQRPSARKDEMPHASKHDTRYSSQRELRFNDQRDPKHDNFKDDGYDESSGIGGAKNPMFDNSRDPKHSKSSDPINRDPRYDTKDPRYDARDPRYDNTRDPRYDNTKDPRYNNNKDPRYDNNRDPRYDNRDPRYDNSKESRYNNQRDPKDSRQRFADQKYYSYDERQYYSDRESSRPSSRNSARDEYPYQPRTEDYPYQPNRGDPRHSEYPPRPSSRMSESDLNRKTGQYEDYYRQGYQQYQPEAYPRDQRVSGPYQRPQQKGYEYDSYQRDMYYASYYDAYQRYAYNNFNYGFYDELYRNDPRSDTRYRQYREAQEQYRQYYAKQGYDEYERSSIHSGRSSANELAKDMTAGQFQEQDIDSNESEFSTFNLQPNYSYNDGQNDVSTAEADLTSTPSSRLTPVKFSYPHPIARFSPGGLLITTIPSHISAATIMPVRIHNLQDIMEGEESFEELKNHQGPLVRGSTHKNDVIEFCTQRIKVVKEKEDIVDRDSYVLLWELMVLLLRQNGSVAGSDIAELLLKDHEILRPTPVPLKHPLDAALGEQHSPADVNDSSSQSHAGDTSSPDEGIVVLHDRTILNNSRSVDVDKITRKFQEFLLFGHKKDALEWAMKHGLWGHALFLASKMDVRTYANVMTRFANSLALNDPLQTLYQLMSGRQPLAVTNAADKKWGDWRPHLAMILSNPSSHPEVDSRSITTLGDTLVSKGCLCAAHFCYIMAQVEFGTFEQKNSKLVLLTADHMLSFEEFASNEAIQCTEIYEYAQSLANPSFVLPHLQFYKFLYALRLVEHGLIEEALHYCEIISYKLQAHPHMFQYDFISEVFKLATQLKYHDPHFLRGQGEFEDQDDPDWLKNLTALIQNFNNISSTPVDSFTNSYVEPQSEANQNFNADLQQFVPPADQNLHQSQNITNSGVQSDTSSSHTHLNYYQPNNWSQQNNNIVNSSYAASSAIDNTGYYNQSDVMSSQGSFRRENSIPSHEENETTDVPSSPVTQTPPFDYYSGATQQEWSSAHSLPSVSLSDADHDHQCPKSDLKALMQKEETESDVALCSSAHSTPLHNYLLSNDCDEDRRMLMSRSGIDVRTLNSCLKSGRSLGMKHKKCIKFDASASSCTGRLQRTGIRRRKFSKKKNEVNHLSDSSPECSPSKEKDKSHSKLSLLATLGLLKSDDSSSKLAKRKRKAKKKNETIEKLLQSKKTFAIDEPFDTSEKVEVQEEKSMEESVQETKKIISILKKLSDEEKKNSELSKLMANEFNKKPPLIFGGTYPIDEPFITTKLKPLSASYSNQMICKTSFPDNLATNVDSVVLSAKPKLADQSSDKLISIKNKPENNENKKKPSKLSKHETLYRMSPMRMFKRMQSANKRIGQLRAEAMQENKSIYDPPSTFNSNTLPRERRDSALSSGSRYSSGSMSAVNKNVTKEVKKAEVKKDKANTQAGKTWLGGIFSRLLPKGPNQMILPDDKNPTIVWDDVKNCWVNKDSNDDEDSSAPVAPPTDSELMGSKSSEMNFQSPTNSSFPPVNSMVTNNSVPPSTASSQPVNKFQRPKTRGMRQNYVDVLSTSGVTKKNVIPEGLFTPSYDAAVSPNVFMPPAAPTSSENTANVESSNANYNSPQLEEEQQLENQTTPMMFNPAEFDSRRPSISNQRHTIGRMGRRTYPT